MKFQTHFSFPLGRLIPVLAASGLIFALLAVFAGFSMGYFTLRYLHQDPFLEKQLSESLLVPREDPPAVPAPSDGELSQLRDRLKALAALEAGEGPSIPSVLERLEVLLPDGVRFVSFQQDQRSGGIQMVVEASDLEKLSRFLAALEGDGAFTRVNLSKQTPDHEDHLIQFSLDMEVRR